MELDGPLSDRTAADAAFSRRGRGRPGCSLKRGRPAPITRVVVRASTRKISACRFATCDIWCSVKTVRLGELSRPRQRDGTGLRLTALLHSLAQSGGGV